MKKGQIVIKDYSIFLASGVIFLFLLKVFQGQRIASFLIAALFIGFYVFWAIYHHSKEEVKEFKNVLEYVLIGGTILILISAVFLF